MLRKPTTPSIHAVGASTDDAVGLRRPTGAGPYPGGDAAVEQSRHLQQRRVVTHLVCVS
jgi:hypothetical protein